MPTAKPLTFRQPTIPQFGVIEGGLLDGWRFGLNSMHVDGRNVSLDVMATAPAWPFPRLVTLTARDFKRLRNPGGIAREHDTQTLIEAAIEAAKNEKP